MNILMICDDIIICFQTNQIEAGYNHIMQLADFIDTYVEKGYFSSTLQSKLQQYIIRLQNLLDICDDEGVSQLFIDEIKPFFRNVLVVN